ncbi:MAG: hypothetical protein KKE50_00120 [Nanoarchaeota archaeon]|nr:hypothetical protein [Nanoarchaeota archaeon]
MLNINKKSDELRNWAKSLLDVLPKKHIEEVVDFIEFLKEKEEAEKPISKIMEDMHKEARKRDIKKLTAEDAAKLIHKRRGVK